VHRQEFGDERSEPLLDRLGVGFVAGGLVRHSICQERLLKRGLDAAVRLLGRLSEACFVKSRTDESSTSTDERLANGDLIFSQVATKYADRGR
jgi:hypothetical protein